MLTGGGGRGKAMGWLETLRYHYPNILYGRNVWGILIWQNWFHLTARVFCIFFYSWKSFFSFNIKKWFQNALATLFYFSSAEFQLFCPSKNYILAPKERLVLFRYEAQNKIFRGTKMIFVRPKIVFLRNKFAGSCSIHLYPL